MIYLIQKVAEKADGTKIETYAVTNFAEISEEKSSSIDNENNLNITNLSVNTQNDNSNNVFKVADGDKRFQQWDSTIGVLGYSRIYINITYDPLGNMYRLESANGGWEIHDDSYWLSNMQVTMGQKGWHDGIGYISSQAKDFTVSYWKVYPPSSRLPVVIDGAPGQGVGVAGSNNTQIQHFMDFPDGR
ncbi:hypothetical protein [Cytobacillus sp. IB215665]|uniref:hypothetical protein n=1 Tax=Cytobacillus sp. IB215665 TaxID=3097357 RepID=UPI002A130925|nr:hypothetical protein [Cytobacillus sp. IB215665]MDX8365493.1 hypothetical protein [Cytobacillus sp. IB215665]